MGEGNFMRSCKGINPFRIDRGCEGTLAPGATDPRRRVVPGLGQVSTWLYDVVDRRARETFETRSIVKPREGGSRGT